MTQQSLQPAVRSVLRKALATLALATLTACAAPEPKALTGDEIRASLAGGTFRYDGFDSSGSGPYLFIGLIEIRENGTLGFRTQSGAAEGGRWRIVGDEACFTLRVARDGKESCVTVTRLDKGKYRTSDGYLLTRE